MTRGKKMGRFTLCILYFFLIIGISGAHAADDTIKLGVPIPMSGSTATYGKDLER